MIIKSCRFSNNVCLFGRYREVCDSNYNFDEEKGTQKAGHFTQLVWKGSHSLGVGVSNRQSKLNLNCTYVVVRYRNAGNILGLFTDEVQRGSFVPDMCSKIISMAESAVQEADSTFDQINPMPNVAKMHGSEASKIQPSAASIDKSTTGNIGGYDNSGATQRVMSWKNILSGRTNSSLPQANLTFKIDDISAKIGNNITSNITIDDKNADQAIRNFFATQTNASQKSQGTLKIHIYILL